MKKIVLILVTAVMAIAGLMTCTKETEENNTNIKLAKSELIDCPGSGLKYMITDTLFYFIENDTLKLQGEIILACGSCLQKTDTISDNTINIYVKDTCGSQANCICSYGILYYFTNFKDKHLTFNVYYKAKEDTGYSLWRSTRYPLYMPD